MAKRRVSRKERARREAIAAGLRRYWNRVRQIQRAQASTLSQARRAHKKIPEGKFRAFLTEARAARETRAYTQEEVAFNLQDRDQIDGIGFYERFRRQQTVTARVTWEYREGPRAEVTRGERDVTWETGDSEEEFWSNYFAAVREYHDETLADMGGSPGKYERFAFFVQHAA